ncbi:phospholipase D-like domain-containing protein [Kitasatospora sp. NPDC054939]
MRLRRTMTTTAALALGVSLLGAPGALAAEDTVPLTTTFNNPTGTGAQRNAIRDHLVSLINRTDKGEEIKGSVFLFTDETVRDALLDANIRGVKVKLILDRKSDPTPLPPVPTPYTDEPEEVPASDGGVSNGQFLLLRDGVKDAKGKVLKRGLGSPAPGAGSWVMTCPDTRGCIGSADLDGAGGGRAINHNKFLTFSRVGATADVVFQSSANLTGSQRNTYYNNAVTIPDKGLYRNYSEYFDALEFHSRTWPELDHYYVAEDSTTGPYKTYFFPRGAEGTDNADPATDTVVSLLSNVDCKAEKGRIRVAMYAFTRNEVAKALVQKQQDGCRVEVLATNEKDPQKDKGTLGKAVKKTLGEGKLEHYATCMSSATNSAGETRPIAIHSKYMLIEGTYLKTPGRKVVFTGSHNYTIPNLRANDETLLKISDSAVYDAFAANFETMKKAPVCA